MSDVRSDQAREHRGLGPACERDLEWTFESKRELHRVVGMERAKALRSFFRAIHAERAVGSKQVPHIGVELSLRRPDVFVCCSTFVV